MNETTNELLEALLNGDTEGIVPRSRVETFLLAMCEKMDGGGSPNIEKTMLYEGTPQKLDLTSYGMGTMYLLSTEDIYTLSYGQDLYYEYTSNGETVKGKLIFNGTTYTGIASVNIPAVQYQPSLGGTGFAVIVDTSAAVGKDLGDISLKLWTEYNPSGIYKIYGDVVTAKNVDAKRIYEHAKTGNFQFYDGSSVYPLKCTILKSINKIIFTLFDYGLLQTGGNKDSAIVYVTKYTFVNGVFQEAIRYDTLY